jgi:quercetin dioxygenase-like cupin family protein
LRHHESSAECFQFLSFDERQYLMEWTVESKGCVPFEHVHLSQEEVFHVRQGEIQLRIDGKQIVATAGETLR